jgi:PAS domain S-box-containing protein
MEYDNKKLGSLLSRGLGKITKGNRQVKSKSSLTPAPSPCGERVLPALASSFSPQTEIILNSIADGVFTVDLNWRVTSFNRAAEEITGIATEEALGRPCCEVFRANVCDSACVLRHTLETGRPVVNQPVAILRADGREIPISVSTALLRNEAGEIIGGVETFRDLSLVEELRKEIHRRYRLGDIISKSPLMAEIFALLPEVARTDSTVLIEGESGTGKELVARALHTLSRRAKGPFVALNCGALPDTLLESELFGHTAGAFTDARRDRLGRFALAEKGTLFLDEIGDISPALQVRLLRVLEEKAFMPLGSSRSVKADVRIVTATHKDLAQLVEEGVFRKDLYYRINVVKTLPAPPGPAQRRHSPVGRTLHRPLQQTAEQKNPGAEPRHPGHLHEPRLAGQHPGTGKRHRARLYSVPGGIDPAPAPAGAPATGGPGRPVPHRPDPGGTGETGPVGGPGAELLAPPGHGPGTGHRQKHPAPQDQALRAHTPGQGG